MIIGFIRLNENLGIYIRNYFKIIGELRDLVTYQEDYIQQLEEEMGFCRNHLAETIDKVRHATLTQEKETQGKNKSIIGLILAVLR